MRKLLSKLTFRLRTLLVMQLISCIVAWNTYYQPDPSALILIIGPRLLAIHFEYKHRSIAYYTREDGMPILIIGFVPNMWYYHRKGLWL